MKQAAQIELPQDLIPQLTKIIQDGDPDMLVKLARDVGKQLKEMEATKSQVRNVFGTVRQIQMRWAKPDSQEAFGCYRDAVLLKPKLSYYANKERSQSKNQGMRYLESILSPALDLVSGDERQRHTRFNRFVDFFEAIVAYHHAAGARD
ncbi:MAG: type III-A CRISPR-associated protein Csm2 [Anaerolineae bacterium]|nr:type III-A CRISPR-associated protein Csm2 [Anaerolineae bacterium]